MSVRIHLPSGAVGGLLPIKKRSRGHTQPSQPLIDLHGPGRLRVAHVLALFGISHSTLYARIRVGAFPGPDGHDGRIPFWKTATIREQLEKACK